MNPDAEFISQVDELSDALMSMGKSTSGSDVGTGGMAAKLYAAKIAAGSGTDMVIANGDDVGVIWDILEGREVGTLFTAHRSPVSRSLIISRAYTHNTRTEPAGGTGSQEGPPRDGFNHRRRKTEWMQKRSTESMPFTINPSLWD